MEGKGLQGQRGDALLGGAGWGGEEPGVVGWWAVRQGTRAQAAPWRSSPAFCSTSRAWLSLVGLVQPLFQALLP